ncbi:MAG: 30S ribosomal protein S6 [Acidobacteriota bacterium]
MPVYETLFILQPTLSEEQIEEIVTRLEAIIPDKNGKVLKTERWGKRRLAFRVAGHTEGYYVRYEFEGDGEVQRELERRMRIDDNVIRHLTTRVDPRLAAEAAKKAERERSAAGRGRDVGPADAGGRPPAGEKAAEPSVAPEVKT